MTETVPAQYTVLLEDIQKDIRLLAEAHAGHTERLDRIEARFEQRFELVERQIMVLAVSVKQRFDAVDIRLGAVEARFEARFEAVDTKLDGMAIDLARMAADLALIAGHLGVGGASHPEKRLPRGATKRRKAG